MKNFAEVPASPHARKQRVTYRYRFVVGPTKPGALATGTQVVDVEVYHQDGGTNIWSGNGERRGVTVSVSPKVLEDGVTSHILGANVAESGMRFFAVESPRYSPKAIAQVAERLDTIAPSVAEQWLTNHRATIEVMRVFLASLKEGAAC